MKCYLCKHFGILADNTEFCKLDLTPLCAKFDVGEIVNPLVFTSFIRSTPLKRHYLAAPYSSLDWTLPPARAQKATCMTAFFLFKGLNVFSPLTYTHQMSCEYKQLGEKSTDFWYELDNTYITHWADSLIVLTLPNYEYSAGVQNEVRLAKGLNLPIFFVSPFSN